MNPIANRTDDRISPTSPNPGLPRKNEMPARVTRPVPTAKCRISVWLNRMLARWGETRMFPVVEASSIGDADDLADLTAFTRQVSEQS